MSCTSLFAKCRCALSVAAPNVTSLALAKALISLLGLDDASVQLELIYNLSCSCGWSSQKTYELLTIIILVGVLFSQEILSESFVLKGALKQTNNRHKIVVRNFVNTAKGKCTFLAF